MSLDNFASSESQPDHKQDASALALLKDSAMYELHKSAYGLAQTFGLENHISKTNEPAAADSALGRNVQMVGRGIGSFIPTIVVAAASKFALGRLLNSPVAGSAENFYLKQSAIGLNMVESGLTGAVTGSLLKPTDEAIAKDWTSFLKARAISGVTSAVSFGALTATTFGMNRVAESQLFKSISVESVIKAAPVNGFLSGAAGGALNLELNSLVNDRKLTLDGGKLYDSIYESAVVGGLLGSTTFGLSKLGSRSDSKTWNEYGPTDTKISVEHELASGISTAEARVYEGTPVDHKVSVGAVTTDALENDGIAGKSADVSQLDAVNYLRDKLGAHSPLFQELLSANAKTLDVADIKSFIEANPDRGVDLLQKVIASDPPGTALSSARLQQFAGFQNLLGGSFELLNRLRDRNILESSVGSIGSYLRNVPEKGLSTITTLLDSGIHSKNLNEPFLSGFDIVNERLAGDAVSQRALLSLAKEPFDAAELAYSLTHRGVSIELVRQLLKSEMPPQFFLLGKLQDLEPVYSFLSSDPRGLENVTRLLKEGASPKNLRMVVQNLATAGVSKEVLSDESLTPTSFYDFETFVATAVVKRMRPLFADDSESQTKLQSLLKESAVVRKMTDVGAFIEASPKDRLSLVRRIADTTADENSFTLQQLLGINQLAKELGEDSLALKKLLPLSDLNFNSLAHFVSESESAKAVFSNQVNTYSRAGWLDVSRMRLLVSLSDSFGKDSKVMETLSHKRGEDLTELVSFIHANGAPAMKMLESTVQRPSGVFAMRPDNLLATSKLTDWYGANSAIISALSMPPKAEFLPELVKFIENEPNQLEARKQLVKDFLTGGGSPDRLTPRFLNAWEQVSATFANEPQVLNTIREFDKANNSLIFDLNNLITSKLVSPELVTRLIDNGATAAQLGKDCSRYLQAIIERFTADDQMIKRLLELNGEGLNLSNLSDFLRKADDEHRASVRHMIETGASASALGDLAARKELASMFGAESPQLERLLELSREGLDLQNLVYFVDGNPKNFALLQSLVTDKTSTDELSLSRLIALERVINEFGEGSSTTSQLLELEKEGASLDSFAEFLGTESGKSLVLRMIEEGAPASKYNRDYFAARSSLEATFGLDSSDLLTLLDALPENYGSASLTAFLKKTRESGLKLLLSDVQNPETLDPTRIENLKFLSGHFSIGFPYFGQLLALEKDGLVLDHVKSALASNGGAKETVIQMLQNGFGAADFTAANIIDRTYLPRFTGRNDTWDLAEGIDTWQKKGLSATQLAHYIEESPSRPDILRRLVNEKADVARVNELLSLSVFPDEIAYRIAADAHQGGARIPQILSALKSWHYGSQLRDLIIERVGGGERLDQEALVSLVNRARTANDTGAERPAAPAAISEQLYTRADRASSDLASTLITAAKRIDDSVPRDLPLVLLGRDMGLFFPLLRKHRSVQYFLWSSKQRRDENTAKQWLKEVPPNAVVIDTGYEGSIIDAIRNHDATASGYLLSRSAESRYSQLLRNGNHQHMTEQIEKASKLIGRGSTYTDHGGAVTRRRDIDGKDVGSKTNPSHGRNRWEVEREIRETYREAGLSPWEVWRYSQYVGLTPAERLGLDSPAEVEAHYKRVAKARAELGDATK